MNKLTKTLCLTTALLTLSAANSAVFADASDSIDVKIRAVGAFPISNKQTMSLAPVHAGKTANKKLLNSGYGAEVSANYFVMNNLAIEGAIGIMHHKVKGLQSVSNAYMANPHLNLKSHATYVVPVKLTAQYHILPENDSFSPYVGAGYHYAFTTSSPKGVKLSNGHGAVLQAGVDIVLSDNLGLNINVDQYFRKMTAKYTTQVSDQALKGKYRMNPVAVGVGLALYF